MKIKKKKSMDKQKRSMKDIYKHLYGFIDDNSISINSDKKHNIKRIMAKKRQRKKIYKIPEPKLEKTFNCPECGRKKVVEVRFNKKESKGY